MLPETPPPELASDFGIERTAFHMNAREAFPGTGTRMVSDERKAALSADDALAAQHDSKFDDSLMADALAEDLANELPTQTLIAGKIGQLQRSIAEALFEKRKQQEIVVLANAKIRQLTVSMHADEVALDGLLISEA